MSSGIEEGLNAGMWTIGLALSGNEFGLRLDEMRELDPAELARRRTRAYTRIAAGRRPLRSRQHRRRDALPRRHRGADDPRRATLTELKRKRKRHDENVVGRATCWLVRQ